MYRWVKSETHGGRLELHSKTDTKGTDYVTFECPHPKCGRRQKQSMYEMENYHIPEADRIPFKCKFCRNIIEVARPHRPGSLLITPDDFNKEMAQRGRH